MVIEVGEEAAKELLSYQLTQVDTVNVRIFVDLEGGWGSGIQFDMVLDEPKLSDTQFIHKLGNQKIIILIDPTTDIYLETKMKLDFDPLVREFLLRSPNFALPYRMRL